MNNERKQTWEKKYDVEHLKEIQIKKVGIQLFTLHRIHISVIYYLGL